MVVVYASLLVPSMILFESFLSFRDWGRRSRSAAGGIAQRWRQLNGSFARLLLFPAGFPVVTLFCFNFIGDGLRDALDPKDR